METNENPTPAEKNVSAMLILCSHGGINDLGPLFIRFIGFPCGGRRRGFVGNCLSGNSFLLAFTAAAFRLDVGSMSAGAAPLRSSPFGSNYPLSRIIIKCSLISGRTPIGRLSRVSTHEKPNNGRPHATGSDLSKTRN